MCHDAICGTLLDSGGCGGAERPARSGGELPTFADGAMRLAFRLEIATSGWAGQEVAADEADCAYISAAARLTSLAPTIELGEEIGSASWRERTCEYVEISVVAVTIKKKKRSRKRETKRNIG